MLKFEHTEVVGWEHAIRGMRNPLNSWNKSDSIFCDASYTIGRNDIELMQKLRLTGTDHRKFLRMIVVYVDITAPLYWWKEFDTYKVGTVANSCSTMHKIADKEFTLNDFSHEHLIEDVINILNELIDNLNGAREVFNNFQRYKSKDDLADGICEAKDVWWQIIQLLPSSYNQKRTVMLNYEVLNNIYKSRKNHKLDEWSIDFVNWIKSLPYAKELIIGENENEPCK